MERPLGETTESVEQEGEYHVTSYNKKSPNKLMADTFDMFQYFNGFPLLFSIYCGRSIESASSGVKAYIFLSLSSPILSPLSTQEMGVGMRVFNHQNG